MANKLLSEIMKDLRNGKDVKNFKFFEKAKEALLATPEYKDYVKAKKAREKPWKTKDEAWKSWRITPKYTKYWEVFKEVETNNEK